MKKMVSTDAASSRAHRSHLPMVLLCVVVLVGAVLLSRSGVRGSWYWLLILLCPLTHLWMMRNMHGGKESAGSGENGKPKKGGCH